MIIKSAKTKRLIHLGSMPDKEGSEYTLEEKNCIKNIGV